MNYQPLDALAQHVAFIARLSWKNFLSSKERSHVRQARKAVYFGSAILLLAEMVGDFWAGDLLTGMLRLSVYFALLLATRLVVDAKASVAALSATAALVTVSEAWVFLDTSQPMLLQVAQVTPAALMFIAADLTNRMERLHYRTPFHAKLARRARRHRRPNVTAL